MQNNREKRIPLRKCVGCGEMIGKKGAVRVVRDKDGNISVDPTGKKSGRGAYICNDVNCLETARKGRKLKAKSFGGVILAADVSAKTEKEIRFHADAEGKEVVKAEFAMDDVRDAIGKRAGVLLVNDEGLFGSIKKQIDKT